MIVGASHGLTILPFPVVSNSAVSSSSLQWSGNHAMDNESNLQPKEIASSVVSPQTQPWVW
jgi:hypothetical protein